VTLECGQHQAPEAPEVAYRAIVNALAHLGMLRDALPPVPVSMDGLQIFEVVDRASEGDGFARAWRSFDAVPAGALIGTRADGRELRAPEDVVMLFPNDRAPAGQEWFYLARPSSASAERPAFPSHSRRDASAFFGRGATAGAIFPLKAGRRRENAGLQR
jgi:hypothetical protein